MGVVAEMCDRVVVMYAGQVVEEADVRRMFRATQHPYTSGLLRSIPKLDERRKRLYSTRATCRAPTGCRRVRFAPRRDQVMEICREAEPGLFAVEPGHLSRRWLHNRGEEVTGDGGGKEDPALRS